MFTLSDKKGVSQNFFSTTTINPIYNKNVPIHIFININGVDQDKTNHIKVQSKSTLMGFVGFTINNNF